MVGFISAVGVNIILGQLANLTGYKAEGANRVIRALNTLIHPGELHLQSLVVGLVTIVLILLLERTRLGPLGLVVAVIATSAGVAALQWDSVATVSDLGAIPRSLPLPVAPAFRLRVTGITDLIGPENIYPGDERIGATLKRAYADAVTWIEHNNGPRFGAGHSS